MNPWDGQALRIHGIDGIFPSLAARNESGTNQQGICYPTTARTLTARQDSSPCIDRGAEFVCYPANQVTSPNNRSNPQPGDPCHTLTAKESGALLVGAFMAGQGAKAGGIAYSETAAPTLKASPSGLNMAPSTVYAIRSNIISRHDGAGCDGVGMDDRSMYTLDTKEAHAVVYASQGFDRYEKSAVAGTLTTHHSDDSVDLMVHPHITGPLMANSHPGSYTGQDAMNDMLVVRRERRPHGKRRRKYIVRRLTPLECCRLQGFPDWWMDGIKGSDSAKYKMWGNGMALPCVLYVLEGVALELMREGGVYDTDL